jgi:hypothetical protein
MESKGMYRDNYKKKKQRNNKKKLAHIKHIENQNKKEKIS